VTLSELVAWGEALGRDAHAPVIITLTGELGTGKTTLAQAICRGYGVAENVTSPTYALVHEYAAPRTPVYHLDLYRLAKPEELTNIGWDDIMAAHALVLIEWPERAADRLPKNHLPIVLDYCDGDLDRRLLLAG
jgi:tRNA threonylcarbamoyladenosine biosynthesis protein TsaE